MKTVLLVAMCMAASAPSWAQLSKARLAHDRGDHQLAITLVQVEQERLNTAGQLLPLDGVKLLAEANLQLYAETRSAENALQAARALHMAKDRSPGNVLRQEYLDRQLRELYQDVLQEGTSFYLNEKPEAARREFTLATEILPQDSLAWQYLGMAADRAGDVDQAIEAYTKALELAPAPAYYDYLGYAYGTVKKDLGAALHWLDQGIEAFPKHVPLHTRKCLLLGRALEKEAFRQASETALARFHYSDQLNYTLGQVYQLWAQAEPQRSDMFLELAVVKFHRAIALNPDHFEATFGLAIIWFNKAAELDSQRDRASRREANRNQWVRDIERYLQKAIVYLEQCHQLRPQHQETTNLLTIGYRRLGMEDQLEQLRQESF